MILSFRASISVMSLLLALALSACVQPECGSPPGGVTLPGSEVRSLKAAATSRNYDLYIRLPSEYTTNSNQHYPVLYVLDGQWDFKLLDSIQGGLYYDGFTPEMIIVGITYSGANPDYNSLRAMDYTPVADPTLPGSGDAANFLTFLKEEVIPLIETNYRADESQRILMGSSFGGLFTLYTLFTEPKLFTGYVAASPAVTYGRSFAFTQEAEYASAHQELPARLFIAVGERERLAQPVNSFIATISKRNYTGLELATRTIEGEGHASNKPEVYNRGLRFIFEAR